MIVGDKDEAQISKLSPKSPRIGTLLHGENEGLFIDFRNVNVVNNAKVPKHSHRMTLVDSFVHRLLF